MNLVTAVNHFLGLFLDTVKRVSLWRIWLLLMAYFAFHWLILYAHYRVDSSLFYGVVSSWTALLDSHNAVTFTHYPGHFLTLPYFFGWSKFILSIPFESLVLGVVAVLFYRSYGADTEIMPASTGSRLNLWVQLILAWLLVNGLLLLINVFLPGLFTELLAGAPRRIMAFRYLFMPLVYIVILSVFYFVIPYVVIHRANFLKAAWRSAGIFLKNPFTCLFMAAVILFAPIIISIILQNAALIVSKFRPELIYWLILAGLFIDIFVNFLWMGTAVRFLAERD